MTVHYVKSWPVCFQAIKRGVKTHDLRSNHDRDYKVGDELVLQEFDPVTGTYTGDEIVCRITYITSNQFPCDLSKAVILSLKLEELKA